jgi:hypothetical protein
MLAFQSGWSPRKTSAVFWVTARVIYVLSLRAAVKLGWIQGLELTGLRGYQRRHAGEENASLQSTERILIYPIATPSPQPPLRTPPHPKIFSAVETSTPRNQHHPHDRGHTLTIRANIIRLDMHALDLPSLNHKRIPLAAVRAQERRRRELDVQRARERPAGVAQEPHAAGLAGIQGLAPGCGAARGLAGAGEMGQGTYTKGSLTETTKTLPALESFGWLM